MIETFEVTFPGRAQRTERLRTAQLAGSCLTRAIVQAGKVGLVVESWDVRTHILEDGVTARAVVVGFDEAGNDVCTCRLDGNVGRG